MAYLRWLWPRVPVLFLLVAPIGAFLAISFFRAEKQRHPVRSPTSQTTLTFFGNWTYFGTFLGTILLCLAGDGCFRSLIGYPIAWFIWRQKGCRALLSCSCSR